MNGLIEVDGMTRGQDGSWYSFFYMLYDGRLCHVGFFNHKDERDAADAYFDPAGRRLDLL